MQKDGIVAIVLVSGVFLLLFSFTEMDSFFTLLHILKWITFVILPWIFLYWFVRLVKILESKKNP